MNQSEAQTATNYVTCPCQFCSGKIEFDANQLDTTENTTAPCPHCGLETIIFVPQVQNVPPIISPSPITSELFQKDDADAMAWRWLKKAAEAGHTSSQVTLGLAYYAGSDLPKDYNEAVKWLKKAAEHGHAEAQGNLAICYMNGLGLEKDEAEAIKWLLKAADQGNAHAEYSLGAAYFLGQGVSKDFSEALKWWHKAAGHGYADAQNNLAVCYEKGDGVGQDYVEALKWMKLAAMQGYDKAKENSDELASKMSKEQIAESQKRIDEFTQSKKEPVKTSDNDSAVKIVQKLAEDGDFESKFLLASSLAEQGNAEAQIFLGYSYQNGLGITKDDTKATKWFLKAAEQGHVEAQSMMGSIYFNGLGVQQDYTEAIKWIFKAVEQGNADAQFGLAVCYASGHGVPQNYVEAYKWANIAAAQGDKTAKEFRDNLSQKLSPKQIAQGQRLAILQVAKKFPVAVAQAEANESRQAIPSEVRREVWRRDQGKCVKCGSRENLEYDHIIPVSKGGSNTARNIELLCEIHNREKRDFIQ